MYRNVLCVFGTLALIGLAGANVQAQDKKKHHHLHHALWELKHAHHELKESKFDFGDLRPKAEHALAEAIKQVEICLAKVGDAPTAIPTKRDLKEEYKKYAHHPHLHHALVEIKHAHTQLKEAKHDFGGHREAALRDLDRAHHEVAALLKIAKKAG